MMLTEGARQICGVQAAVESMRNEVVKRQDATIITLERDPRAVIDITEQPPLIMGEFL
ncbi:hypothetical protein [Burkholderia singularis]|uniref:hypothetical protein n=1 Tax=Burkholderia singularis TaxID=1503053 RepID=UPI000B13F644|nr:hypothetical protein [Burkholderia singularis]